MSIRWISQPLSAGITQLGSIVVADFNRDGKLDLVAGGAIYSNVVGGNIGTLTAFLGDGAGNFSPAISASSQQFSSAGSMAAGDFNNDGNTDVIAIGTLGVIPSNVFVALGNGRGEFTPAGNLAVSNDPVSVGVGDVNGDGRLDAVTANGSQTVSVLLGDGKGGLSLGRNLTVQTQSQAVALQDLNGDGRLDMAVVSYQPGRAGESRLTVLLGNGQGDFVPGASTILSQGRTRNTDVDGDYAAITTGDFDKDGRLDIAASGGGKLSILTGDPSRSLKVVYQLNQAATSLYVGDFNGDGQSDLASSAIGYNTYRAGYYTGSGTTILLGDGSGQFSRAVSYATDLSKIGLGSGDLDQNGQPDLALALSGAPGGNNVLLLLNRTTQTDAIAIGETNRIYGRRQTFVDASSELRASVTIDLETRRLTLNTPKPFRQTLPQKTSEAIGTRRDDLLRSSQAGSFLNGWGGDDRLVGSLGQDRLLGGAGDDELTGGNGPDQFIFSATPNYSEGLKTPFKKRLLGVDQIVDFNRDQIVLDPGTFTQLKAGRPVRFATVDNVSEARLSRGLITYVRDGSRLYYNANGSASGFGSGGLFAILEDSPALQASNFSTFP